MHCINKVFWHPFLISLAHMEAHGLNILLSSTANIFNEVPFMHSESTIRVGGRSRSNRVIPGAALTRPIVTSVRGARGQLDTDMDILLQAINGGRNATAPTNVQTSPLVSSSNNGDSNSPSQFASFIPRRSSRGNTRRVRFGVSSTDATVPSTSNPTGPSVDTMIYQVLSNATRREQANLRSSPSNQRNTVVSMSAPRRSNHLPSLSAGTNRQNNVLSISDILSSGDFHDPLYSISQQPRSFATNGNQVGAGGTADTALEILDDSDDESSIQVF